VATLVLQRERSLNAFDAELAESLRRALKDLQRDDETRVIVITGAGEAFSAGQDIFEMAREEAESGARAVGEQLRGRFAPLIAQIRAIEKPIIAQINGVATGAGLAIALACDFRVAADTATFVMSPIGLGLIPGSGLSLIVPRLIGIGPATEHFLLGSKIDAVQAMELGLLHRVAAARELHETTCDLASRLAAQPALALGLTKRALNRSLYAGLDEHMAYEAGLQELAAGSADHRARLTKLTFKKDRT
jgi:2-(1,2-epoxy-1,2-dihydrophenyl)acetyl-CoA isomerase